MDIVEIARAMYEAPAPDETEGAVWPPGHPGDVGWWMSRATAVMPLVRRAQAEALREARADIQAYTDSGAPFGHRPVEEFLLHRADRIEQNSEGNETWPT